MPFVIPNSFGTDLVEVWSDAARAASLAARQRRAKVKTLQLQRATTLNQMLSLISTYGSIRKSVSAQKAWRKANDLTGEIQALQAERPRRPLLSRVQRAFRFRKAA